MNPHSAMDSGGSDRSSVVLDPVVQRLVDASAGPLRATLADLAGLPPALVVSAEADVVRDEGEQYARLLRLSGVPVTAVRYLGTVHDVVSPNPLRNSPPTRAAISQGGRFLGDALARRR